MMSDAKESIKLIHKALSLKKNFSPYIKLYLEILFSLNQVAQVKKLLKKYWSENPSSILRNVIADLLVANNLDNLELIKSVVNKNINHDDSKKLLIFFAIRLNNWELARSSIKGLLNTKPSRELCLFMADIESGEFNDIQKSDAWKLRAKNSDLEHLHTFKNVPASMACTTQEEIEDILLKNKCDLIYVDKGYEITEIITHIEKIKIGAQKYL